MRVIAVLALVLVAVGCHISPDQRADDVCNAYCDCVDPGGLPATLDKCVEQQCKPNLQPVSDACIDCVYAHDQVCTDLFAQCSNLCLGNQTPLLGGS